MQQFTLSPSELCGFDTGKIGDKRMHFVSTLDSFEMIISSLDVLRISYDTYSSEYGNSIEFTHDKLFYHCLYIAGMKKFSVTVEEKGTENVDDPIFLDADAFSELLFWETNKVPSLSYPAILEKYKLNVASTTEVRLRKIRTMKLEELRAQEMQSRKFQVKKLQSKFDDTRLQKMQLREIQSCPLTNGKNGLDAVIAFLKNENINFEQEDNTVYIPNVDFNVTLDDNWFVFKNPTNKVVFKRSNRIDSVSQTYGRFEKKVAVQAC